MTTEIKFTESSKACTVQIKVDDSTPIHKEQNDLLMEEAKRLYDVGRRYSAHMTMGKSR